MLCFTLCISLSIFLMLLKTIKILLHNVTLWVYITMWSKWTLNDSLKCPCFPLALPDSGQQRVTKLNHQRPFQLTEEEDSPLSSISTIFLVWPLLLLLLLYHRFLLLLLLLRSSLPSFHCSSSTQLLLYSVSPPSSSPWTTLAKRRRPCSWWLKPTKRWRRLDPSWEECSGKGCSPSLFTRVVWCWCVCVCVLGVRGGRLMQAVLPSCSYFSTNLIYVKYSSVVSKGSAPPVTDGCHVAVFPRSTAVSFHARICNLPAAAADKHAKSCWRREQMITVLIVGVMMMMTMMKRNARPWQERCCTERRWADSWHRLRNILLDQDHVRFRARARAYLL